ncbi:MAG: dihydropteroate synthase [Lachnospiraceae bacterium]|jgi:dihydropteroate synthase|nr:dihydropteroate synthase [Lachnospiraceae bacterium]
MKIGSREFDVKNHTYVMGILNRTPDSFSDGGRYQDMDRALFQVERMLDEGMDILDIGGESTRPGYTRISPEEEIQRVVPVIEKVKERFEVPISLDTCKSQVALAGIRAGADMINDIWGLKDDGQMARVIAQTALPCCLMHNRKEAVYGDFVEDVITDLAGTLAIAEKAGIESDKIILDPGVGFGKTLENNLEIISKLERLRALGCPLLLGTSRKSVIGLTLNLPVQERVEGTLVTTVFAVQKGCAFVRVHDVRENVRTVRMTEALLGA